MSSPSHRVFAVYDNAAGAYLQPFFMTTIGLAIRAFEGAATDQNHQFFNHAGDYTLFEIGTFDEVTGELVSNQNYSRLMSALEAQNRPGS